MKKLHRRTGVLCLHSMNLRDEILYEHSRRQVNKIADWIGNDKRRFCMLMRLLLHGDFRVTQRSAWVMSECAERYPALVAPWLKQLLRRAEEAGVHVAVRRNVFRILQWVEIPQSMLGHVVSHCFDYLVSEDETIAVRVYSMMILLRASQSEPDLGNELHAAIEQMLPNAGAAIQARAKMVLKKLDKEATRDIVGSRVTRELARQ